MAKFLTGEKLSGAIHDLIYYAKDYLIIVSPYIKLDNYLKQLLEKHKGNRDFWIFLAFGKNSRSIEKSLSKGDLEFFKAFANVYIAYISELHGKYYASEKAALITSLNLHQHSINNNIEFGFRFKFKRFGGNISDLPGFDADYNIKKILQEAPLIYLKLPVVEKKGLLRKTVVGSEVVYDITDALYDGKDIPKKTAEDFPDYVKHNEFFPKKRPERIPE